MKGRPQAAHFAAFPRPPNYNNPNSTAHTYSKEKKLKRILTSVFLVLAVIAAVGIFGIQSSNPTEAQATPTLTWNPDVNDGKGVPDVVVAMDRSLTIDLADYVKLTGAASSTLSYALVAAESGGTRLIWQPPPAGQTGANAPRWNAPTELPAPDGAIDVSITGSKITITPRRTGIAHRIHWVADSSEIGTAVTTNANTYDTFDDRAGVDRSHTGDLATAPYDDFVVTVVAAQGAPADNAFPTDAPVKGGLASDALTTGDTVNTPDPVTWTVAGTYGTAYRVVAPSADESIAETSSAAGVITITPKSQGTVSIGPVYMVHHLWQDNPADAPTTAPNQQRWTIAPARQFTVTYAQSAPRIDIVANTASDPATFDKTGEEDSEIVYTIRSDHSGVVGRFRTVSTGTATYTNRNVIVGLTNSGNQNLFEMETGDSYRAHPTIGPGAPAVDPTTGAALAGAALLPYNVTAVEATLRVASGATLATGTYTFTVVANDQINEDGAVQGGAADSVEVTVKVVQGNQAPTLGDLDTPDNPLLDDGNLAIPENTTTTRVLLDLNGKGSDPDRNTLSYSVEAKDGSDGEDAFDDFFSFPTAAGATGRYQLTLKKQVNYEDTDYDDDNNDGATDAQRDAVRWTLVVTASDGSLDSTAQEITVTVTDAAEVTPTTGITFPPVPENNAAGASVGTVRMRDADGDEITSGYGLSAGANGDGKFRITPAGVLTVIAANSLDYETKSEYLLAVTSGTTTRIITVTVADVNEAPVLNRGAVTGTATPTPLATADEYVARISESIDVDEDVPYGFSTAPTVVPLVIQGRGATDQDGDALTYSLVASQETTGNPITSPEVPFSGPFEISNASTGAIKVSEELDVDTGDDEYVLYVKVSDDETPALFDTVKLTITIVGENEPPIFVTTSNGTTEKTSTSAVPIDEDRGENTYSAQNRRTLPGANATATQLANAAITTYFGWDPDGDDVNFVLRTSDAANFFSIRTLKTGEGRATGYLLPAATRTLNYENQASYLLEIEVTDGSVQNQTEQTVNLNNLNDNSPAWQDGYTSGDHANNRLSVAENTLRGHLLATYLATDADGDLNPLTYTLSGVHGSQYQLGSADALLKTLASLDFETRATHDIAVTASDGTNRITRNVRITIGDVNDRIGSITVKMANPLMGPTQGDPNSALADRKTTLSGYALTVPEAPGDIPARTGSSPFNFVETAAARWGSVLRIEVLAQSPDSNCGNGNQCVVIELEGVDSDHKLKLMAYRQNAMDNKFIAAVMPWEHDIVGANHANNPTSVDPGATGAPPVPTVYKHVDNSVARIHVDEEDTLRIKFGNLRDEITIDNEAPEFSNFLPEHETSIDDEDVEYTFTVTDAISGIPEPEDLPDGDGDENYMPVVALIHSSQCRNVSVVTPATRNVVPNTNLHGGAGIVCNGTPATRDINDDKDLDQVTDGYDVTTELALSENTHYVTFIVCDAAGNCVAYDPDENDLSEALAEIIVDTTDPVLEEARTGVMWDAAADKYDKDGNRRFIQVLFKDASDLNPDTIEADDFVVDGHTIKDVYTYDDPDDGEEEWDTRFDTDVRYRAIAKTVFIELEEELLPDATPDVSLVPNGIEDKAGNEQDDGEKEAKDFIAPSFMVTSIESPRQTSRDNVLVGEDEKVTLTVTSDERINATKPRVQVNYVNAPAGCVNRDGIILSVGFDDDGSGRIEPDEARPDCARNAVGGTLNSVISRDSTQEWTITVDKPTSTGYYNVYIQASDRSTQKNEGSEGVAPTDIAKDFFEKDGDVNADDAVFFEGDIQLPKPQVIVSGKHAGDSEPTVEFKRPLFVEIDFTENFNTNEDGRNDCSAADKISSNADTRLECVSEGAEYAEDGFDTVTITRFELDGVDMTDDVKTTDDETFLVALDDVGIGDHKLKIQAIDVAGNELTDVLEIEFAVEERDPFTRRLNPGWNLVSLPGSPADSAIASVFGSDIEVRTVYTYNPVTPGGWQVAVRETLDDAWQGDLTDITAKSGYWVLSDAIQDLEVSIPRLAGGAVGASTPVQPPVIPMYAGWNLIPVVDVTGDALDTKKSINATTYLNSLDDGLDLARVLGFNTITNEWFTVIDPSDASVTDNLQIGSAYWVFVRESASLVPGGIPR